MFQTIVFAVLAMVVGCGSAVNDYRKLDEYRPRAQWQSAQELAQRHQQQQQQQQNVNLSYEFPCRKIIIVRPETRRVYFHTENGYFHRAVVNLKGVTLSGVKINLTFRLHGNDDPKATLDVPAWMLVESITITTRAGKKVRFDVRERAEWNLHITALLSSCPVKGMWTRARLKINENYHWRAGLKLPANLPAEYM